MVYCFRNGGWYFDPFFKHQKKTPFDLYWYWFSSMRWIIYFTVVNKLPWYAILSPPAVKWTIRLSHCRSVTYKYQHDEIIICLSTGRFMCWTISVSSSFISFHKTFLMTWSPNVWFYFCCSSQFHRPHSSTMDPSQGSRQVQTKW